MQMPDQAPLHDPQIPGAGAQAAPRVWLVLGDKRGDNGQVETIERGLPWPCERKTVHMLGRWVYGKPRVRPSLHHIDRDRSDPLDPPWPDLIITVGRRPSMVALWIRKQSKGHTKIVLVTKPSGMFGHFDLVIHSAEAQLPPLPNVLAISLPLMRANENAVTAAAESWRATLNPLPRPLIAILVGGPTNPFVFNGVVIRQLIEESRRIVEELGGTPYISTSRRTPERVVAALKAGLPPQARLFQWSAEATENPYLGLLGLADGFVVTGDSISMMVEVVRLRKPLAIFALPAGALGVLDQARRSLARLLFAPVGASMGDRLRKHLGLALFRARLFPPTRDFGAFHRMLIARGLAVPVGEDLRPPSGEVPDDVSIVVGRIKALMGA
jgi:mitochondrial fission protein ELM1